LIRKKVEKNALAGVCIRRQGVAIAKVRREVNVPPVLERAMFQPSASPEERAEVLPRLIESQELDRALGVTALELGSYSLVLVEAPDVKPDELRAAIRWRIRDLIDFHIDDAVVDAFEIPQKNTAGRNRMMYAVVAKSGDVRALIDELTRAGLRLDVVDIPEMALRNIAALLPEDSAGMALLHLGEQRGLIVITRQQKLYMSRRIETGLSALPDTAIHAGDRDTIEDWLDRIITEIQRSLDYYDSHFSEPPVSAVVVCPTGREIPGMTEYMTKQLGIAARILDVNAIIDSELPLDGATQADCLLAIGAALRQESRVL
jgi:MSHA biogenesis protein MshI